MGVIIYPRHIIIWPYHPGRISIQNKSAFSLANNYRRSNEIALYRHFYFMTTNIRLSHMYAYSCAVKGEKLQQWTLFEMSVYRFYRQTRG